jgi:hypothetical protein
MKNWDWEDTWQLLCVIALAALMAFLVTLVISPKAVDDYYLSRGGSNLDVGTCVYAHWTWHTDEKAYCTNDAAQAVDLLAKLKATLNTKGAK